MHKERIRAKDLRVVRYNTAATEDKDRFEQWILTGKLSNPFEDTTADDSLTYIREYNRGFGGDDDVYGTFIIIRRSDNEPVATISFVPNACDRYLHPTTRVLTRNDSNYPYPWLPRLNKRHVLWTSLGMMWMLMVQDDLRGRGLGRFACRHLDQHVQHYIDKTGEARAITLGTRNPAAAALYKSNGYVFVKKERWSKNDPPYHMYTKYFRPRQRRR